MARIPYRLKDGTVVPSVTTITSRFKESGGLINWAWKCGMDGVDYRTVRDDAANAGTLAHAMIECHISGENFSAEAPEDTMAKAKRAFDAYLTWADQTKLKILETERRMVSEKYRYGGTWDALGEHQGKLVLVDWKSSASVHSDYLLQLAAYKNLIEENRDQRIEGFYLCRFGKDTGDFSVHWYEELNEAWEMFLCLRRAYELDKSVKRRAA
jgi:hypothetical protein